MRDNDIGAVPICEHGHLVGIVTDRDIACRGLANGHDPRALRARDVMSDHVVFCQDDEDAEDAVLVMEIRHIRRLPVLDRRQRL
ncbi:MAG: CBS domain-containing protein, partial [Alphaproteobacteria bacterium]